MSPHNSTTEVNDYGIGDKDSIPGKAKDSFLFRSNGGGGRWFPYDRYSARRQAMIINMFLGSSLQILGKYGSNREI
jgi:hypothetical protein